MRCDCSIMFKFGVPWNLKVWCLQPVHDTDLFRVYVDCFYGNTDHDWTIIIFMSITKRDDWNNFRDTHKTSWARRYSLDLFIIRPRPGPGSLDPGCVREARRHGFAAGPTGGDMRGAISWLHGSMPLSETRVECMLIMALASSPQLQFQIQPRRFERRAICPWKSREIEAGERVMENLTTRDLFTIVWLE